MPKTLTIELPDEIYELLEEWAKEMDISPEQLAADWIKSSAKRIQNDPLSRFIGAIETEIPNWGERHDELIGEYLLRELRGEKDDA